MTPRLGIQLYTVRNELGDDFDGTLGKIAGYGYRHVQPYNVDKFVDQLAESLPKHGLDAPSTHANPFGGEHEAIIAACERLGVKRVIQPSSPKEAWESAEGIADIAKQLNELGKRYGDAGLEFGYHNHAYELESRIDGRHGLELLADQLDDNVVLELDTYWAVVGGADVTALLGRLGERVRSIHIKDGDGSHDNKAQVAVGAGQVDVAAIIEAAKHFTDGQVELDDTTGDMLGAVRESHGWLQQYGEWA
ncbi:sugar phosphate isomerase/epimerase family protein [Propionibacteriaceae bacterium Y2011]